MMKLTGNKWMQKREIEKNMQLHWKNLEEKTSTGASWREESPRKSMLNKRRSKEKQREINEVNNIDFYIYLIFPILILIVILIE